MMNQSNPLAAHLTHQFIEQGQKQSSVLQTSDAPRNKKLWRASLAFEAMFVRQLLSSMHKTIPSSGLVNKGFAEDVQSSMFNQALAKSIGGQGKLGIAKNIYRQISHLAQAPVNHTDKIVSKE